jgi:sugar lactone lactonase YvrE
VTNRVFGLLVAALAALAALTVACGRKPQAAAATASRVLTVEGFKTPESVKYDADLDVYFVTSINGNPSAKDNNGLISRIRPDGSIESLEWVSGGRAGVVLHAPKGTAIVGDTLWVADIDAVRGFNKRTGARGATVDVSRQGAKFLNDLAVGADGALYVTDTGILIDAAGNMTHPGPDRIFRVGTKREVSVAVAGDTLARPNGIAWDAANDRFIVVAFGGPAIFGWKPGDAAPTVVARGAGAGAGAGQWDGVELLADGRIVASSWADSTVDVIAGGKVERLIGGVPSPADIGLDTKRQRVLIPVFTENRVEVWALPQPSAR